VKKKQYNVSFEKDIKIKAWKRGVLCTCINAKAR